MTAPQPSLTGPSLGLLQGIFGGQGGGSIGGNVQQQFGNPLQQQLGNTFSQLLSGAGNPLGGQGGGGASALLGQAGGALSNQFLGQNPGLNVLQAYQPLFQRNLQQIQGSGPRFSSGNDQLRARSLQDYNAFAGQTLMQGQQQQMQAALGAGQLGQGILGGASQFGNQQMPLLQQLLGSLFGGGDIGTPAVLTQTPGLGQQLAGLAGTLGGFALGGPLGAGLGSQLGGLFGGGGGAMQQGQQQQPFNPLQIPGGIGQ